MYIFSRFTSLSEVVVTSMTKPTSTALSPTKGHPSTVSTALVLPTGVKIEVVVMVVMETEVEMDVEMVRLVEVDEAP